VPATVKQMIGTGAGINRYDTVGLTLQVEEPSPDPLIIEGFGYGVKIEHRCNRTVVLRHGDYRYEDFPGAGKLYLEDVQMPELALTQKQPVWARQINLSSNKVSITNSGSKLWILGLEIEGTGTAVRTAAGGATEVLGTLLYPARSFTAADAGVAFINDESSHSLIYATSDYVMNGNFPIQVREIRDGVTMELPKAKLVGRFMPLYSGFRE
jgi:hypothetical protein